MAAECVDDLAGGLGRDLRDSVHGDRRAVIGYAIGLVLGLLLLLTRRGGLTQNVIVYNILDKIVNIVRSIPFIILMALLVGVTRVIVGTSIGTEAMIVPIVGATVPVSTPGRSRTRCWR